MYIFLPITPGWCALYAFLLLIYGWAAWLFGRWLDKVRL